jgi:dienelactone hydrolase
MPTKPNLHLGPSVGRRNTTGLMLGSERSMRPAQTEIRAAFKTVMKQILLAILAVLATTLPALAASQSDDARMPNAPMHEQVLKLAGDPARPVTLEATLFEPPGAGPFPLAVINHGAQGEPRSMGRYRVSYSIDYFLSRGYAVILPMMRGFAGSGGEAVVEGCDVANTGKLNAKDILAVIAAMKQRHEIDAGNTLVMGQSFGGWNSLALATMAPPEVKGIVNFVGGIRSNRCNTQDAAMWEAMADFGHEARVPSLWFYGERDELFPKAVWQTDFERFTQAGGQARLVNFGKVDDAHNLLGHSELLDLWVPDVDAYLAQQGLPNRVVHPEYMPPAPPAKTNYAKIDDSASVPVIGRAAPEYYQRFLNTKVMPRALVIGPHSVSVQSGGFDPVARAMADCHKASDLCMLYAYNDDVVWTGPAAGDSASVDGVPIVGTAVKSGKPVLIQQFVSLSPDCKPKGPPALKLLQAPAHGNTTTEVVEDFPSFPPTSPLAACNSRKTQMVRLSYSPASGFEGVDFLALKVAEGATPARTVKFALHVH